MYGYPVSFGLRPAFYAPTPRLGQEETGQTMVRPSVFAASVAGLGAGALAGMALSFVLSERRDLFDNTLIGAGGGFLAAHLVRLL